MCELFGSLIGGLKLVAFGGTFLATKRHKKHKKVMDSCLRRNDTKIQIPML